MLLETIVETLDILARGFEKSATGDDVALYTKQREKLAADYRDYEVGMGAIDPPSLGNRISDDHLHGISRDPVREPPSSQAEPASGDSDIKERTQSALKELPPEPEAAQS